MYNTGNPIGSTAPKDFSDNAEITDRYVNDVVNENTQDRFGRSRLTLHGIEKKADSVFASLGFFPPVDYTTGLTVDSRNFTVTYNGVVYAAQPYSVPFTTGAWDAAQWYPIQNLLNQKNLLVFATYAEASAAATTLPDEQFIEINSDETLSGSRTRYNVSSGALLFVSNLDQLRLDLTAPGGALLVGHQGSTVAESLDALFMETQTLGERTQDLETQVSLINQLPYVRKSIDFGGQLKKLASALSNPFNQFLGVCLAGDSITWGMTASGMASIEPRAGALSDARNNGSSPSWANLFHKHLGRNYFGVDQAVESPWPGSPSGVAQFEYVKIVDLFPGDAPFSTVGSFSGLDTPDSTLGRTWYVNMNVSGAGPHSVSWNMTGKSFDLVFSATTVTAKYRLYVNEVLQGEYSTNATDLGIPTSYKNYRRHDFQMVRNGTVRIEAVGADPVRDTLLIEAIRINRVLRVTNQGIIGSSTREFVPLIDNAVRADDSFCFVQLGVNDRGYRDWTGPSSQSAITNNLLSIVASIKAKGVDPILMAVNKAVTTPGVHYYSTLDVRSAVVHAGNVSSVDVVDNFSATNALELADFTVDGLHPNDFGHRVIANNIINSFE